MLASTDMAVIGACFHDHSAEIDRAGFQPEWLVSQEAREVVGAILTLVHQNKAVNPLNVMATARGVSQGVWGEVLNISKNGYGDVDWRLSVKAARDVYLSDQMDKLIRETQNKLNQRHDPNRVLSDHAAKINTLLDTGKPTGADPASLFSKETPKVVWRSMIPEFNTLLGGGYRNGMLVIYCGCTGQGKSTALITHAVDCVMQGKRVTVIVNERPPEVFFQRVLRGTSGLSEQEIQERKGSDESRDLALRQWMEYLQPMLRVYDREFYTPRRIERAVAWDQSDALLIDYLQDKRVSGGRKEEDPVGEMASFLLDLQQDRRIPIFTAGQMSDSNTKDFIKKGGSAGMPIIYGTGIPGYVSSIYVAMKKDNERMFWEYFHCYKNTFLDVVDYSVRVEFDRNKFIYRIPPPALRGNN